ncbi:MAG: mechanosensitive ion channel [Gemmatimonadales bacterium]|jgi:small-conductance mechanosensitive channel
MDGVAEVLGRIQQVLTYPIFTIGDTEITLWTLIYLLALTVLLIFVSGRLKQWLAHSLLKRYDIAEGARVAIATLVRYCVVALGFIVIVQSSGIDLSALTVLAGALGVGLGFGLQNIINNFESGLIILFERPIKIGDRVDVGNLRGNVVDIRARATTIVTNDNIAIIVPNSEFISQRVTNWSFTDANVRTSVPVGVAYGTDPAQVRRALLDVAAAHPGVLGDPKADVLFTEFADSSLNFALRVWTSDFATRPAVLRSELNFLIAQKFADEGIQIPFPQRDLHIKSGPLVELPEG